MPGSAPVALPMPGSAPCRALLCPCRALPTPVSALSRPGSAPVGLCPAGPRAGGGGRQARPGPITGAIRAAGGGASPASAAFAGSGRDRALPSCAVSDGRSAEPGQRRTRAALSPSPAASLLRVRSGLAPLHPFRGVGRTGSAWQVKVKPLRPPLLPRSGDCPSVPSSPSPPGLAACLRALGWKSSRSHRPAAPAVPGVRGSPLLLVPLPLVQGMRWALSFLIRG